MANIDSQPYRNQLFRELGFRCIEPTVATLLDGSQVTIQANIQEGKVKDAQTIQPTAPNLRHYTATHKDGLVELIEEPELERRLGTEAFNNLPK